MISILIFPGVVLSIGLVWLIFIMKRKDNKTIKTNKVIIERATMNFREFILLIGESFIKSFGWYFTIVPPYLVYALGAIISKQFSIGTPTTLGIAFLSLCQMCLFFYILYGDINDILDEKNRKLDQMKRSFQRKMEIKEREVEADKVKVSNERKCLLELLNSSHPFCDVAQMKTDAESAIFQESVNWLTNKRRPAYKAADEVRWMKNRLSKILLESKVIEYKYDYILSAFPEIKEYVDKDNDLISIGEQLSYQELDETRDRRKDYLSPEEYSRLTDTERSQLALDRYIQNSKKNKWQIGRDYEMSCAFQLRSRGYNVEMHGIKYKKADLGRDLIAVKNIWPQKEVCIVQCKNWSHDRTIHENVIMQLVGTTIEYQISLSNPGNQVIIPVLMIPSYSTLSDTAIKFAEKLNVRIEIMENIDFPRIKCNVNGTSKIYHLPFDQQYDRTEIKLNGECYAFTVVEAESKGFRRAMRHCF